MKAQIRSILRDSIAAKQKLDQKPLIASIEKTVQLMVACLKKGSKIILFGNGGSAADAQHIAAELIGRFTRERKALAAIALGCNSSNITCIANDYEFGQIFSRQIEALGQNSDLAIGISTSGSSPNILAGIISAKKKGMPTVALTSEKGRQLSRMVDVAICVPDKNTARIQEAHIIIGHIICELTEKAFCDKK